MVVGMSDVIEKVLFGLYWGFRKLWDKEVWCMFRFFVRNLRKKYCVKLGK